MAESKLERYVICNADVTEFLDYDMSSGGYPYSSPYRYHTFTSVSDAATALEEKWVISKLPTLRYIRQIAFVQVDQDAIIMEKMKKLNNLVSGLNTEERELLKTIL